MGINWICALNHIHSHTHIHPHTVSSKVQDLQLELKALREQVESTEGELVLKNQKLADVETEAKITKVWLDVLSTQAKELQLVQETSVKNSVS